MTLGVMAGVLLTAPAGAWADSTAHKRVLVPIPGICVVLASVVIRLSPDFRPVALSQVATGLTGAAIVPAVTGVTLGMFGSGDFSKQNGINQAWNDAGNAVGAGLSGLVGWA